MPHQPVPPAKRRFARSLRRDMTEAEDRLWQELRGRRLDGMKFRRQMPVGKYIADFVRVEAGLIVEMMEANTLNHLTTTHVVRN
jgi:very-short-patch-repair endonuclease